MSEVWWSYRQTINYLVANYPCEGLMHASFLVESRVEDGTLQTRLKTPDGMHVAIRSDEWRRDGNSLILETSLIGHGPGNVEYLAPEIQKLRSLAPGAEVTKRAGGRPPYKDWDRFWLEVIKIANGPDGLPESKAELQRRMLDWGSNHMDRPPQETSVRDRVNAIWEHLKL